ncbi:MAG TPA: DJ-1/PfpI family protein [Hyphomonadaceae bacterium]|nr:DJ-1/PfpI family protein [Hyphomonadaceae bacterium]
MTTPFRIVFAIYDGMTHLDFTGPHMFFSRLPGAEVIVASEHGGTVDATLQFAGTVRLADIEACDLICVPGGMNATEVGLRDGFTGEVRRLAETAQYVTSVCTGSLILGAAGLLNGKRAACHWAWRDYLAEFGAIPVAERVVRDGILITGGGVTAGIDFALSVIGEIAGLEVAQRIQLGLEYDPQPPYNAGSPETAPKDVLNTYRAMMVAKAEERLAQVRAAAAKLR